MVTFSQIKQDLNSPGQAVMQGTWLDWFVVFGLIILLNAGWYLILKHLKGASL